VGYPPEAAIQDLPAIEAVCEALEGYPLGIELAASMTRALSVQEIQASLQHALDLLDHGPADAPARHRAVRAALEPSWALLRDDEREVATRLAMFRSSFQTDAATAVSGASLAMLLRLVDRAVLRSEGSSRGRFGLHPVMLAFLRERTDEDTASSTSAAHRRFFEVLLKNSVERVQDEPNEVLDRIRADLPDIVHAIVASLEANETERAIAMMHALVVDADYLQARGGGTWLIDMTRRVAQAAEAADRLDVAERLWVKAANAVRSVLNDMNETVRLYRHALGLAERTGNVSRQVMLHAILGAALNAASPAQADEHLATARALAEAADDDAMRCEVLQRAAYVAAVRNDHATARDLNEAAVSIAERMLRNGPAERTRANSLLFYSLFNLGAALDELGEVAASVPFRMRALEVAKARGQQLWAAHAHQDLAIAHLALGNLDDAFEHAGEASRIYGHQSATANLERTERLMAEIQAAGASR